MKKTIISELGKPLSQIGLGCVTFGREIDEKQAFHLMHFAVEHGIIFFDTAASYMNGLSEKIIGNWLSNNTFQRDKIIIATKLQPPYEPSKMLSALHERLRNLNCVAIDVLYLHRWDITVDDLTTLKFLDGLIDSGKVRCIGVSNFNNTQLENVFRLQIQNGLRPFLFVQNNNNLAVREINADCLRICKCYNAKVVSYSPLAAGFLTGKYQNGIDRETRFDIVKEHQAIYFNEKANRRLKHLHEVASKTGYLPELLAMAWAVNHRGVDSILVGCRTISHIRNALSALKFNDKEVLSLLECQ